jgi:hypothetical protein
MWPRSSEWITPNALASVRGTRMPATVTPAPLAMWLASIWPVSMR